jgi:hypothetical protein
VTPGASRPAMPAGDGLLAANAGSGVVPWSRIAERRGAARDYWLATARPDGRPPAMPRTAFARVDRDFPGSAPRWTLGDPS